MSNGSNLVDIGPKNGHKVGYDNDSVEEEDEDNSFLAISAEVPEPPYGTNDQPTPLNLTTNLDQSQDVYGVKNL
jgi:hypothetical protein